MLKKIFTARNISTHNLTKRLTPVLLLQTYVHWYFNSQPHEEADAIAAVIAITTRPFQLTASRRGWRTRAIKRALTSAFQLTASRRGWRWTWHVRQPRLRISTHSLTKRLTTEWNGLTMWKVFQLTASRRGWRGSSVKIIGHFIISTHSLTKRLTANGWMLESEERYFNSQPHEEADALPDSRNSLT